MQIGLVYPQTEFGNDPTAIRDYAQMAEEMGFSHILTYDHVLGANPERPEGWKGPYMFQHPFQSPLLLYSFMAAMTQRIHFAPGIIILPQRQTALFAKQAATLDILSGGRLRLGIGLGWNKVEYIALGENFHNRGKRIEEQIELMRRLWTQPLVTFEGRWHTIPDAGLNPLPVQRPIPIWIGGNAEPVLRRVAFMSDGWMPNFRRAEDAAPSVGKIESYLEEAGRSWSDVGIEARMHYGDGDANTWAVVLKEWQHVGATHISFNTMGHGFDTPDKHMAAIHLFAEAVGVGQ
jgi:probable F420-dependent oxidoreductase